MQHSYSYQATVRWTEKKKGIATFEDPKKQDITLAVAPEFMGHQGVVTPEDLFVTSVASCHMAYFLGVAQKMHAKFTSYQCNATGTLSAQGMDYVFSKVHLDIRVSVAEESHVHKALRALDMSEKGCFVANSINSDVTVTSTVEVAEN